MNRFRNILKPVLKPVLKPGLKLELIPALMQGLLIASSAHMSLAQAPKDTSVPTQRALDNLRDLVDRLDTGAWIERDLASTDLSLYSDEYTLADIELYLQDPTLSQEQHSRLMNACYARFIDFPKGGLGVAFGTIQPGSIEVDPIDRDPRFPASALLNPGDAIARVDGKFVRDSFEVRAQILSRQPGETLPVTIKRGTKLIEMDLPLGSFNQLSGPARMDPLIIARALAIRWERLGIISAVTQSDATNKIGTNTTQESWTKAAFPDSVTPNPQTPSRRYPTAIVGGGIQQVDQVQNRRISTKPWESATQIIRRSIQFKGKFINQRYQIARAELNLELTRLDQIIKLEPARERTSDEKSQIKQINERIAEHESEIHRLTVELNDLEKLGKSLPPQNTNPRQRAP
jgi:PDZ domain